jgi:hypothetical protein
MAKAKSAKKTKSGISKGMKVKAIAGRLKKASRKGK